MSQPNLEILCKVKTYEMEDVKYSEFRCYVCSKRCLSLPPVNLLSMNAIDLLLCHPHICWAAVYDGVILI